MTTTDPGDFRVWSGAYCGKTLAEVHAVNPSRVKWYAEQRTKLGRTARLFLLAVKHGRVHLDAQGGCWSGATTHNGAPPEVPRGWCHQVGRVEVEEAQTQ